MESVRLRVIIRLVQNGRQHRFQTSQPGFKRFSIFSDKLIGLELVKPTIVLDKPIYLGAAILDLSKLLMYRFWYDVLKVKYSNIKLCFTDTDSLLYWVETVDLHKDFQDTASNFDTCNYPTEHPLFDLTNKAVPGLMKDEFSGKFSSEFVGLRSKLYSCKVHEADGKMAAAGIKRKVAERNLLHEKYKSILFGGEEVSVNQTTLRSYNHTMYTIRQRRCALSAIDNKRYMLPDLVSTRALGDNGGSHFTSENIVCWRDGMDLK